jgi:hypothetical protein
MSNRVKFVQKKLPENYLKKLKHEICKDTNFWGKEAIENWLWEDSQVCKYTKGCNTKVIFTLNRTNVAFKAQTKVVFRSKVHQPAVL